LERGIELAEQSVEASRDEIRKDTGIDARTFDELARPIENKTAAPWLKSFNEDGVELVRAVHWDASGQTGSWVRATQEEIDNGILAKTRHEYEAKKVA
jgi:hypothetical protein